MKPEKKQLDLSDNEKAIFEILKKEKSMNLVALKSQAGLSNKGWDKGMKGLAKHGLTKVTKSDETKATFLSGFCFYILWYLYFLKHHKGKSSKKIDETNL